MILIKVQEIDSGVDAPVLTSNTMHVEEIRVAIVDAIEADREHIRSLLASEKDTLIVAEWADGAQALSTIDEANPDILFVDVESPDVDRLELAEERPAFVYVASCRACAVKAFDVGALDFLLKPFEKARFDQALRRARDHVRELRQKHQRRRQTRVIVRSPDRVVFLRPEEIDWVEAAGNYLRVHARGQSHLLRLSMRKAERCLDPETFLRIHRSAIVNIDRITDLTPWSHGEYVVTMNDGTRLHASRTYARQLDAFIDAHAL